MQQYMVLYRDDAVMAPADPPLAFQCSADDADHAEEQLLDAEPAAEVLWIVQTDNADEAYNDFWGNTPT
jgi:hypothetical protein